MYSGRTLSTSAPRCCPETCEPSGTMWYGVVQYGLAIATVALPGAARHPCQRMKHTFLRKQRSMPFAVHCRTPEERMGGET